MKKVALRIGKHWASALALAMAVHLLTAPPALAGNFELGIKAYRQGDYDLAVRYLRHATYEDQNNPNVHYYLADSLVKASRYEEAQIVYQRILSLAPYSQAARFSRVGLSQLRLLEAEKHKLRVESATRSVNAKRPDKIDGLRTDGDDYLDEVTDNGRLIRWSVTKLPLKLYIERSPVGVRNFQPSFINNIRKAMDVWVKALDNRITYVMVDSPEEADIRVYWVNTLDTRGQHTETGTTFHAGITVPEIRDEQLKNMEIKMATFDIAGKPQSPQNILAVAIHEMGHAMGLLGHSEDIRDIMYAQNQLSFEPSTRDLNTIRRLYGNFADITHAQPSQETGSDREEELAARLDEQIKKEEKLAFGSGSNLNWLNLGTTYFSKGKDVARQAKKLSGKEAESLRREAQEWYDKGVSAINRAIELEPQDALAYYNRCIIYQEYNNLEPALQDIEAALKFDRNNAKYYREKAWILGKLKRKAEAQNALDAYLIREPYAAGSPEVDRIRKLINQS